MSLAINIEQKPFNKLKEEIKAKCPKDVYNLEEVKAISGAIQEHMIFIGLDRHSCIRDLSVIAIGKTNCVYVDVKDIVRKALNSASEYVVLVHNHPSNSMKPSDHDKEITTIASKLLNLFHIKFSDHIIVNEKGYISMLEEGIIEEELNGNYTLQELDETLLMEENYRLKGRIEMLENQLKEREYNNEEEEFSI